MKPGDSIAIPGEGEFKLVISKYTKDGCIGCAARHSFKLCSKLPADCTFGENKIWIKVEKLS